ncbi:MAG TPA: hypothetical protein VF737_05495, partial [Gemmatimonadaceae bacterium]
MAKIRFSVIAASTAATAVGATALLYFRSPALPRDGVSALVLLAILALLAELLSFLLPHNARGSIAFVPYLASVLIVPHWYSVIAIVVVTGLTQIATKNRFDRGLFNVAQHALTLAIAILVYLKLGGDSFITMQGEGIAKVTNTFGLAAVIAYAVSFFLNTLIVSAAIAVLDGSTP